MKSYILTLLAVLTAVFSLQHAGAQTAYNSGDTGVYTYSVSSSSSTVGNPVSTTALSTTISLSPSTTTSTQVINTPPVKLPISSLTELCVYATEQVAYGTKSVNSDGILYGSKSITYLSGQGDVAQIMQQLDSQSFSFDVFDVNRMVSVYATLTDSQGYPLFWGYTNTYPTRQPDGSYSLNNASVTMRLASIISIAVPGANNAYVQYTDESGNTMTQYLDVYSDRIQFRSNLAGKFTNANGSVRTATLILEVRDFPNAAKFSADSSKTTSYAYSLNDGKQLPSLAIRGTTVSGMENYKVANDSGLPSGTTLSIDLANVVLPAQEINGPVVTPPHFTVTLSQERDVSLIVSTVGQIQRPDLVKCLFRDAVQAAAQDMSTFTPSIYPGSGGAGSLIMIRLHLKAGKHNIGLMIPEFESASGVSSWWNYGVGKG